MKDDDLAADLLDGIPAIAAYLGLPVRRTYELAEKKKLPLFKLGERKWQGRKSTLRRHIEELDAHRV
jgi:excisionase family DNA binding protein